jgi:hypothetical protein
MRSILTLALVFTTGSLLAFDEIPLPKQEAQLEIALAKSAGPGKRGIIIRVLERKSTPMTRKQLVTEQVSVLEDGKEVVKNVQREVEVTYLKTEISGFREVTLLPRDIEAKTVLGETIPNGRLVQMLNEERPVLLNYGDAVEPFHLATTKPNTVVLGVKSTQIYPDPSVPLRGAPDSIPIDE